MSTIQIQIGKWVEKIEKIKYSSGKTQQMHLDVLLYQIECLVKRGREVIAKLKEKEENNISFSDWKEMIDVLGDLIGIQNIKKIYNDCLHCPKGMNEMLFFKQKIEDIEREFDSIEDHSKVVFLSVSVSNITTQMIIERTAEKPVILVASKYINGKEQISKEEHSKQLNKEMREKESYKAFFEEIMRLAGGFPQEFIDDPVKMKDLAKEIVTELTKKQNE